MHVGLAAGPDVAKLNVPVETRIFVKENFLLHTMPAY